MTFGAMYMTCIIFFALVFKLGESVGETIHTCNAIINLISKEGKWMSGDNVIPDNAFEFLNNFLRTEFNITDIKNIPTVIYGTDVTENLPEYFDAREKWPNCPTIREIRDQGECGSCWAFGGIETITDRVCTYSNGTKNFNFSTEDILTCNDERDGCNGGRLGTVFQRWVEEGIVSGGGYKSNEGCKPYSVPPCEIPLKDCIKQENYKPTPPCLKSCREGYHVSYDNDKKRGKGFCLVMGEKNIMTELYTNGPVLGAFELSVDFVDYKSGIYHRVKGQKKEGHAIKVIGWGVDDGTKYWLAANSWGTEWGDQGFFKTLRGSGELLDLFAIVAEPLMDDY